MPVRFIHIGLFTHLYIIDGDSECERDDPVVYSCWVNDVSLFILSAILFSGYVMVYLYMDDSISHIIQCIVHIIRLLTFLCRGVWSYSHVTVSVLHFKNITQSPVIQ